MSDSDASSGGSGSYETDAIVKREKEPAVAEDEKGFIRVDINDAAANEARKFADNNIKTARYTWWNFVPKNLFEQFQKFSNIVFLVACILSAIPSVTPVGPSTTITPLAFVIVVAAIKDAYEDYLRHKADRKANSSIYTVIRTRDGKSEELQATSAEILAGDIVRVEKEREFPADLLLLASSEREGLCYVETSNLDGETNLKRRLAPAILDGIQKPEDVSSLHGFVQCEAPSPIMYQFRGNLHLPADKGSKDRIAALGPDNLLLRGSMLRNARVIHGLVIYAGVETKLFKNLKLNARKASHLQRLLNKMVALVFVIDVIGMAVSSGLANYYHREYMSKAWYLGDLAGENPWTVGTDAILTFFILFIHLVPISLFVTVELVRSGQVFVMEWDPEMALDRNDWEGTHMLARNSSMNEELGIVDHVFSDKTGTLTRNVMETAWWSIDGKLLDQTEDRDILKTARTKAASKSGSGSSSSDGGKPDAITDFLRALVLCSTVVPESHEDGHVSLEGQSPDEVALVAAARDAGIVLTERLVTRVALAIDGKEQTYEILATLEFSSDRKRMTAIVRFPDGKIRALCKGADTVIAARLRKGDPLLKATQDHVDRAANKGLRTLMFATRVLDEKMMGKWLKNFAAAQLSLKDRDDRVTELAEEIEHDMTLIGASAVEDKLQDQVPETIRYLLEAGVKVWVLTGDKQETAENIGYSSGVLEQGSQLIRIIADSKKDAIEQITHANSDSAEAGEKNATNKPSLIIDGYTLDLVLENDALALLNLADRCQAVICCRVTPLQKALVVSSVRKYRGVVTLAIGDGANDVSMLQTAHVGVGVFGNEGMQAVRAADYAIHGFRLLAPLLAKHGRYNLIRLSALIHYSFYKNLVKQFPQLLFYFNTAFTGTTLFEQYVTTTYNIFWASMPPLFMGYFDTDVNSGVLRRYPRLYNQIKHENVFTKWSLWGCTLQGLVHGTIIFVTMLYGVPGDGPIDAHGKTGGAYLQAFIGSTACVLTVVVQAGLDIKTWNPITAFGIFGSFVGYFLFMIADTQIPIAGYARNASFELFRTASFWLGVPIMTALCIIPTFIVKCIRYLWFPHPWMSLRVADDHDRKNGIKHAGWEPTPTLPAKSGSSSREISEEEDLSRSEDEGASVSAAVSRVSRDSSSAD